MEKNEKYKKKCKNKRFETKTKVKKDLRIHVAYKED